MKKKEIFAFGTLSSFMLFSIILLSFIWVLAQFHLPLPGAAAVTKLVDESGRSKGVVDAGNVFKEMSPGEFAVICNPKTLYLQINEILHYFDKYQHADPQAVNPGIFSSLGITMDEVRGTLRFIRTVIEEDRQANRTSRLLKPGFWQNNFRFFHWTPYGGKRDHLKKIRITKYAVFTVKGSKIKKLLSLAPFMRSPTMKKNSRSGSKKTAGPKAPLESF